MQSHQIAEGSNKWRALLSCTAGRPIDPDVFHAPFKGHQSSRKARRDRFVPLNVSNKVGVRSSRQDVSFPREAFPAFDITVNNMESGPYDRPDIIAMPFAQRFKTAASPNSPSKSHHTHATSTTLSSSTANDSFPHRHSCHSGSDGGRPKNQQHLATTATTHTASPNLTITASPSFGEDVSYLSFHIDDEDADGEREFRLQEQSHQLQFWRHNASGCFDRFGIEHCETATAFLELGVAHLRCEQYSAAQDFFRTALRVFEKKLGPNDLRVAKTLEKLGTAQSRGGSDVASISATSALGGNQSKAGLLLGLQSFRKCFRIRYDVLGPAHIDTVETLNKIANIYMKLQMHSSAKNDYMEVLTLRTAILGGQHPSVAVAAQSLGIAHLQRQEIEQAKAYFLQALNVFALIGLGNHPMADQLREDIRRLGFDFNRVEI